MNTPPPPEQDDVARAFYFQRLDSARDQRAIARPEYDDMTYEMDYFANQQVAYSYLRKKKNDDEVRINTGTAEKKVELILNELLSMNFQPEVRAFDEDDLEVEKLGDDMSDLLKRTNEIERDDDLYQDAFLELLTQRALFMEEIYGPLPSASVRTGRTGKFRKEGFVQKRFLSGLQVYLGDITIPAYRFQEQPYVVKYNRMTYEEGKKLYGHKKMWKYVRPGMPMSDQYGLWFKYRLADLTNNEIEVIDYYSTADNEWQQIINGVMMEEPGTPLPWNHGGYNISMTVVKRTSPFLAYGKPPIASAKALQGLADETIRNLVRKMRQAIEPPTGVRSGRVYSKDIWSAGAMTQGATKEDFSRLIDHDGVTTSEFQMYQLMVSEIEKFIGPYSANQAPGAGIPSATQVIEQQKQSIKMLGLAMLAAMRVKRDMSYLRLWNIFDNYFEPIDASGKYRSFTINGANLGDGVTGKKVLAIRDEDMDDEEKKKTFELEEVFEKQGKPVRFRTINAKKIKAMPLTWYIVVNSQERESGAMDRVLFQDKIAQASNITQLTGVPLKSRKVIDGFESTWKAKGWFETDAPAPMSAGGSTQDQAQGLLAGLEKMGGQMAGSKTGQALTPKPMQPTQGAAPTALAMNQ